MNELHISTEMAVLIIGGAACTLSFVIKIVLLAYDDVRQTWRQVKGNKR